MILVTPSLAGAMADVPDAGRRPGHVHRPADRPRTLQLRNDRSSELRRQMHRTAAAATEPIRRRLSTSIRPIHPRPLITPVPVQELPPGAPQGSPPIPPTPGPATSTAPPHGAGRRNRDAAGRLVDEPAGRLVDELLAEPIPPAGERPVARRGGPTWRRRPDTRCPASPGGAVTPASANSTRGNGLYEPQSGLYVPAASGSP